jgi:hypothetical protein
VIVSVVVVIKPETVKDAAVVVSWLTAPDVPLINVAVPAVGVEIATFEVVAFDGATDRNPSPNADTTTSARRLKFVFVDICFLSVVVKKTFPFTAGKEELFAS